MAGVRRQLKNLPFDITKKWQSNREGNLKTIEIGYCDECRHWHPDKWVCEKMDRENEDPDLEIPDWCPLP